MTTLLAAERSGNLTVPPLLYDANGEPLGCQSPRYLYSTNGDPGPGQDAIDLAYEFGVELDEWQQLVVIEGLRERPRDGKWSAFEVGLMVSRQNGKTELLVTIELAGLLIFGERRILHTAHLFQTAVDGQNRLAEVLARRPDIVKFKAVGTHGSESVELTSGPNKGAKVDFMTRTKKGGLGLPVDRVIFDEAMFISQQAYQALRPTLAARDNAQIWLTGSAVDQRNHDGCEQFAAIRHRALNSEPGERICYLEWSVPDDADPSKPDTWAYANPALGSRISVEDTVEEYKSFLAAKGMRGFGIMRLGIGDWPQMGEEFTEIPADRWQALRNPGPEFAGPPVLVLYRAPNGGPWSITGGQRTTDGRLHVEVGYAGEDIPDVVVDKFIEAVTAWGPAAVIVGRGGAAEVTPKLEAAGFEVHIPNQTEEAQACGGFLNDTFASDTPVLSHSDQHGLNRAVSQAVKRELPSKAFVWDVSDETFYPQLMGATLAHWGLLKFGSQNAGSLIFEWPTDDVIDEWLQEDWEQGEA